jgi:hypothetical protein
MKVSAKDLSILQQAATVADAQRELVESCRRGFGRSWHAEAGILVVVSGLVLGVAAIVASATMPQDSDLKPEQIVLQRVATASADSDQTIEMSRGVQRPFAHRE